MTVASLFGWCSRPPEKTGDIDATSLSLAALAAVAVISTATTRAEAQYFTFTCDDACEAVAWTALVAGVGVLAVDVELVIEGIDKATAGHGLYQPGATLEIVWGGLQLAGAAALWVYAANNDPAPALPAGIFTTVMGAYLLAHGIWSLTAGRPPDPGNVTVSFAPLPGGGRADLMVRF